MIGVLTTASPKSLCNRSVQTPTCLSRLVISWSDLSKMAVTYKCATEPVYSCDLLEQGSKSLVSRVSGIWVGFKEGP